MPHPQRTRGRTTSSWPYRPPTEQNCQGTCHRGLEAPGASLTLDTALLHSSAKSFGGPMHQSWYRICVVYPSCVNIRHCWVLRRILSHSGTWLVGNTTASCKITELTPHPTKGKRVSAFYNRSESDSQHQKWDSKQNRKLLVAYWMPLHSRKGRLKHEIHPPPSPATSKDIQGVNDSCCCWKRQKTQLGGQP